MFNSAKALHWLQGTNARTSRRCCTSIHPKRPSRPQLKKYKPVVHVHVFWRDYMVATKTVDREHSFPSITVFLSPSGELLVQSARAVRRRRPWNRSRFFPRFFFVVSAERATVVALRAKLKNRRRRWRYAFECFQLGYRGLRLTLV